jgi:hypothetical protein
MPLSLNGVVPVFGFVLSGWKGSLVCVALGLFWIYCAQLVYEVRLSGWLFTLASLSLMTLSTWISFSKIDLAEIYALMGYSEAQLQAMSQFKVIDNESARYFAMISVAPVLVYTLAMRRFFPRNR